MYDGDNEYNQVCGTVQYSTVCTVVQSLFVLYHAVSANQWTDNYRQINMDWDIFIFRFATIVFGALHLTMAFAQGNI